MLVSFFTFPHDRSPIKVFCLGFQNHQYNLFIFNLTVTRALQRMEKCHLDICERTTCYCGIHYNVLLCKNKVWVFFIIASFKQFIMYSTANLFRIEIKLLWHVLLISFLQIEQKWKKYLIVKIPSSQKCFSYHISKQGY